MRLAKSAILAIRLRKLPGALITKQQPHPQYRLCAYNFLLPQKNISEGVEAAWLLRPSSRRSM